MLHQSLWRRWGRYIFFPFPLMRQATKSPKHTNSTEGSKDSDGRLWILQLPTLGPVVPRGTQASFFFVLACPVLKRRRSLLAAAVTSSCIFSTVALWTNYILAKGTTRNWQAQALGKAQYRQWANLRQEAEFSGSSAKGGKETELNTRMVSLFPSRLGGTRSAV